MAEVYWIHLPEHTDMFSEGYIGITSKTAQERFKSHLKDSKRRDRHKYPIHNAIAKYGDKIIVETLVICSDEYAAELECKLRPDYKIGWNIIPGGGNSILSVRDIRKSIYHSEESKAKMSESQKKSWQDNPDKLRKRLSNRKPRPLPLDKNGNRTAFWRNPGSRMLYKPKWEMADQFYEYFTKDPDVVSKEKLISHFNLITEDRFWVSRMIGYFLYGWNPLKDELWLSDFKRNI